MNTLFSARKVLAAIFIFSVTAVSCPAAPTAARCPVRNGDKIVFLGDSITFYGSDHSDGYCQLVLAGLKEMKVKARGVFAGVGGHKSDEMLARIEHDVIKHRPRWMVLSCGINDVWHGTMRGRKGVDLPEFRNNVKTMVEKARQNGIKVILLTATVIMEDVDSPLNKKVVEYNQAIAEIARTYKCILADTGKAMRDELAKNPQAGKDSRIFTVDGVHMKRSGDEVMAEAILRSLGADDKKMANIRKAWQNIPPAANRK